MAHEGESSSLSASGSFTKEILATNKSEELKYNNTLTNQIIEALIYLKQKGGVRPPITQKSSVYEKMYCIDGSLLTIPKEEGELVGLRIGSALLNTKDLFNIEKDRFGTPNPLAVAQLFNNKDSLFINGLLPSKNTYIYENNHFYTLQESFIKSLDNLFDSGLAKTIKDSFSNDMSKIGHANIIKMSNWNYIDSIVKEIREESIVFSTRHHVKKIMLITESILSQYLLQVNSKKHEDGLIVLDGRLQNQDIGSLLKELNPHKIKSIHNMLVGIQKTGILNQLLSKVHQVIKNEELDYPELTQLKKDYLDGKPVLLILNEKFKEKCGIQRSGIGTYGRDCFYITQAPDRKEFIFTLPDNIFDKNNPISGQSMELLNKLCSVFEYANTNLYIASKGALLTNILAHDNVSLTQDYTEVIGQLDTPNNSNNTNNNANKMKI